MVKDDTCNVAFVMGKAKVIPKGMTLSVLRLELTVAIQRSQMHHHIKKCADLSLSNCCLYSDLYVVLDWICNGSKRLKENVVRKIAEFKRSTCKNKHFAPTCDNVAD